MFEEIKRIIGTNDAMVFCARFGGQAIYMSRDGLYYQIMKERIGEYKANTLFDYFDKNRIEVPRANDLQNEKRNAEIRELHRAGESSNVIAYKFDMTTRNVRRIANKRG